METNAPVSGRVINDCGVFIAVTSRLGAIEAECFLSVLGGVKALEDAGYDVMVHCECGNPYIPIARDRCVSIFLPTGFKYLIFVDDDLSFDKDAFLKIVEARKDVCFAAYPFKCDDIGYPVQICTDERGYAIVKNGLIVTQSAPTGLMCIDRTIFERMIIEHPEWEIERDKPEELLIFSIFDTGMLRAGSRKWYGEDYLFCLRCADLGYSVWCYPNITISHTGKKKWTGNYHEYLLSQPKAA